MDFNEWFYQQQGPKPWADADDEELGKQVTAGHYAALKLQDRKEWEMARQAALRAWFARGYERVDRRGIEVDKAQRIA